MTQRYGQLFHESVSCDHLVLRGELHTKDTMFPKAHAPSCGPVSWTPWAQQVSSEGLQHVLNPF